MYDYFEDAVDSENRDLSEKVLVPSKSNFSGKRYDRWDANDRERTVESCEGTLVVTHTDADGLVSAALLTEFYGTESTDFVEVDYDQIESVLELIVETDNDIDQLFVTDLNLDEVPSVIDSVVEQVGRVTWLDHHEWEDEQVERLEQAGVELTVNEDRCGAGIVYNYIVDRGFEPSDTVDEVVEMTEDHDLWLHELDDMLLGQHSVCVSKVFADFAFWSDSEDFVTEILDIGGEFMEYEEEMLWSGKGDGFLAQKHAEHELKLNYIIQNETTVEQVGEYTVAFAHGRANPGRIVEEIDSEFDFLVHTKPSYPVKVSIRAPEEAEFTECHRVAGLFGGGGHEKAAGCTPEFAQNPMEFMEYIVEHGEPLQEQFRQQIRTEL